MKKLRKNKVKKVIPGSGGIMSEIARRLSCDWHTAESFIKSDEELSQLLENEKNLLKDMAETNLIKLIERKDLSAIKYYLSTQAKDRGYIESKEVDSVVKFIDLTKLSNEQLERIASGEPVEKVLTNNGN